MEKESVCFAATHYALTGGGSGNQPTGCFSGQGRALLMLLLCSVPACSRGNCTSAQVLRPKSQNHRIIDSLRLEKTSKIIKSHRQPITTMPAKPCPEVPYLYL